jgi:serine/threonine protein kinase
VAAESGRVGAIAGGAVGGAVLLALVIFLIVFFALRSRKSKDKAPSDEEELAARGSSSDSLPPVAAAALAKKQSENDEYIASKNITNVEPMNAGGAFGSIFTAEYLGSEVALKKMSDASPDTERALKKELAAHKKLQKSCPNIAKVYDLWRAPPGDKYAGDLFMVMELFHEGSLLDNFDTVRATPQSIARILHSCSKGLMQIHAVDVLHRDIAARNYLVRTQKVRGGERMEAFLADFGLAGKAHKEVEKKPWRTTAPESQGLDPSWSQKSDVWSFGLLIYEVASGGKPFAQLAKCPKNFQSMQKELLKYNERPPGVSDALWALFEQCVSYDPEDRPAMADVEQQLRVISQDTVTVSLISDEYN